MKAPSLPVSGLRQYFAGLIRLQRSAIHKAPCTYPVDIIRKEKLQAQLQQTRFIAKDIAYFSHNPDTLA